MLVVRIWNYIRGYVIIKVEGINLERFINLAIAKGIYFWDIERINYTTIRAGVGLGGYKQLRKIRKKVNCRVSILEKRGCPFLLHRVFKRKALLAGGITAVLIMYFLTSFVWVVEVEGTEKVSEERIIRELESFGLKPGAFKYFLDTGEMETKLLIEMDQLVWAGINIMGTRAVVDVVERTDPPALIDKDVPCNIVAKKDGIINNIFVYQGQAEVKEGSTVKAGQLLINGVVEEPGGSARIVHAMGRVEARTWYQMSEEQDLRPETREPTGRNSRRVSVRLGKYTINLTRKKPDFEHFDSTVNINRLVEWRNISLPVELIIENCYEVNVIEDILTEETAVRLAADRIRERLAGVLSKDAQVMDEKVKYYPADNSRIRVEVVFEALEDIGMEERIELNTGRIEVE